MCENDVQDLFDRRTALLDAIEAGVSCRDRLSLNGELAEVAEALAVLQPPAQPGSSAEGYPTRDASPLH